MTEREALKHLKAVTEAFGPDEGVEFDQKAWSALHAAIKEALMSVPKEPHKQEPVPSGVIRTLVSIDKDGIETWKHEPFYTTPPTQCKHCLQRSKDEL